MAYRPIIYKYSNPVNCISRLNAYYLERLFFLAESPVNGIGVFARVNIEAGCFIGEYEGPKATAVNIMRSPYTMEAGGKSRDGRTILRFLNHDGENPNAEFDSRFRLNSLRGIKAGEEVTFDYGMPLQDSPRMASRVAWLRRRSMMHGLTVFTKTGAEKDRPDADIQIEIIAEPQFVRVRALEPA